jgi:hypothetical protein
MTHFLKKYKRISKLSQFSSIFNQTNLRISFFVLKSFLIEDSPFLIGDCLPKATKFLGNLPDLPFRMLVLNIRAFIVGEEEKRRTNRFLIKN